MKERNNTMNNDAYNNLTNRQRTYVDAIHEHAEELGIDTTKTNYSRAELRQVSMKAKGKIWIPNWITHDVSRRQSRGVFSIPEVTQTPSSDTVNVPVATDAISNMDAERIAENILVSS